MIEKNEQIRQLVNRVHLAGQLAQLEIKTGDSQKGIPYISLRGAVQCGTEPIYTVRFRSFCLKTKSDGTDNGLYSNIVKWAKEAIPMTKDKDNCTWVDLVGSINPNDYINKEGNLQETYEYNISFFSEFQKYYADIDIEGYIYSIKDEVDREGSTTGRKRLRLISKTQIGNQAIDFKNIMIPEEYAYQLEDAGYEPGRTATFFITLTPNVREEPKSGGLGKQRITNGRAYLEYLMTGAREPVKEESKDALDKKVINNLLKERNNKLDAIKNEGYKGSDSSDTPVPSKKETNKSKEKFTEVEDDEEFPF